MSIPAGSKCEQCERLGEVSALVLFFREDEHDVVVVECHYCHTKAMIYLDDILLGTGSQKCCGKELFAWDEDTEIFTTSCSDCGTPGSIFLLDGLEALDEEFQEPVVVH